MLSFLISAAWETPLGKDSVVTFSNCQNEQTLTNGKTENLYEEVLWGLDAMLKYVYIFLQRVACLVGYNFMIHSTCHTSKESSVLFLFGAKHCILYCVFIGLSKYTNGHCFPKRLLFKRWIFLVSLLLQPLPSPIHLLLPPPTQRTN